MVDISYRIKDYMVKDVVTADVEDSAVEASKTMLSKGVGSLIVLEKGRPKGIVTERDLVQRVMGKDIDPAKIKIAEVMSRPLITVDPDAFIEEAVKIMVDNGICRLAVSRNDIIYGIFTARDLIQHFNEYEDKLTRDIIKNVSTFPQLF